MGTRRLNIYCCSAQNGQQNASITSVIRLTSQMCSGLWKSGGIPHLFGTSVPPYRQRLTGLSWQQQQQQQQLYFTTYTGVTSVDNYRWVNGVVMSSTLCELEISFGLVFWVTLDFELRTQDIRRTPRGTLLWHNCLQCWTFIQGHSRHRLRGRCHVRVSLRFWDTLYYGWVHTTRRPGHELCRSVQWSMTLARLSGLLLAGQFSIGQSMGEGMRV